MNYQIMNKQSIALALFVLIVAVFSATSYITKGKVSKADGKRFDKCTDKCSDKADGDKFKKCMWKCWDPKHEKNTLATPKAPVKTIPDKVIDFAICYGWCTLSGGTSLGCAYHCLTTGNDA
jgi:hypothetical protein